MLTVPDEAEDFPDPNLLMKMKLQLLTSAGVTFRELSDLMTI